MAVMRYLLLSLFFVPSVAGQSPAASSSSDLQAWPPPTQSMVEVNHLVKKLGHYSKDTWAAVIDATWGEGLPTPQKLRIFDLAWVKLDRQYGAFPNLDIDLDSLKSRYRPEIEAGVSRGRFAAIMNYLTLALQDAHTLILDRPVNGGTALRPGIPLFVLGAFSDNAHFGASLTPLPDSSLLVFRARPNQRLGLVAGDLVLGYDGLPWKVLYKELLEAQLPLHLRWSWGSTERSFTHQLLASAGLNWHLFDTIDIVKYATGDTLHLSTARLANQWGVIWGNEQLPIPGVSMPGLSANNYVSWGMVEGTQVGYIYVSSWTPDEKYNISEKYHEAVRSLVYDHETTGLIIDMRYNTGGSYVMANKGHSLLFDEVTYTIAYDVRDDPNDHYSMKPSSWATPWALSVKPDYTEGYYDKPIAVLIGPGTVSNGDVESWRLKFHPHSRLFGKPSSGALSISHPNPNLGNADWYFRLASGSAYLAYDDAVARERRYLIHTDIEIDEEVWLTQEDVARGKDTVVEAALVWISGQATATDPEPVPGRRAFLDSYPNPFQHRSSIQYRVPKAGPVTITVYDVRGREIATLYEGHQATGVHQLTWSAEDIASGVYFIRMMYGDSVETTMTVVVK